MTSKRAFQTPAWMAGVLCLLMMFPAFSFSATAGEVALPGTRSYDLASPETGRDYRIQVAEPEGPPPAQGYPVLYLLDGNAYLPLLQVARDTLMRSGPREGSPLLIVAIGYPDADRFDFQRRAADYTPPDAAHNRPEQGHGGADRFLAFINQTLKPDIDSRYPIDRSREALLGHSLGGLFTLHVLLTEPDSFKRYIAISPSLWWYGDDPLQRVSALPEPTSSDGRGPSLLLAVGGQEQTPDAAEQGTPKADTIRARAMVDNVGELAEWLHARQPQWPLEKVIFPGEGHGSVMWPAARRAMTFIHR